MGRILGRLFVCGTLLLITFIGYSSQIFVIWPWYGHELSVELLTLLIPFNALLGMVLWNYYLVVTTDPGRVPREWQPNFQSEEGYEVKKLTRGPRYCRTCENYKPPRAHHCRQCKRCVLRMDHHCPWVNNCVGHFNYGYFIRFLFYVDMACTYHLIMVTRRVMSATSSKFWDEPSYTELIFIILNYTFCGPVLLAVGGFSIYHFNALLKNTTTIEGWEKDKVATLVRRGKIQDIKFPYHIGTRKNIEAVLGANAWLWCWPTKTSGSGLKYPVADPTDPRAESWPPKDPHAYPSADPNHVFTLPESPWTYENGSLNPNLQPSNLTRRASSSRRRRGHTKDGQVISSVPPYHPDYRPPGDDEDFSDSPPASETSTLAEESQPRRLVRRGSEGYEVHAIDREGMLQEYVTSQMREPGRYNVYMPDSPSASEDEEDEDVPLATRVESWRNEAA
ncbi:hypothetical protein PHLGIDRAFT_125039 [Phlebiopsis gigantea 11061_1 CR5-6]|uniref:Palmitoyltransferase PFA4 n=1 Tax=Phlebiopsis gigantea (strain 11061_1 CR5-6) TaxID=745531 RepID=A0A0C3SCR0_PHLG1|nr:hypothetical protein PHLGIDRAFT_125039 [Phlebiopsis gigantea 11061_1 CR5-6]